MGFSLGIGSMVLTAKIQQLLSHTKLSELNRGITDGSLSSGGAAGQLKLRYGQHSGLLMEY